MLQKCINFKNFNDFYKIVHKKISIYYDLLHIEQP